MDGKYRERIEGAWFMRRHVPGCVATSRRRSGAAHNWLVLILLILTVLLVIQMMDGVSPSLFNPDATPRAVTPRGNLAEDEQSTIELFESASRSVVHIESLSVRQDRLSFNVLEIPKGTGSGIIWDADGHVVTNYHVIEGAQAARVTLFDDSAYDARLVEKHPDKDIAVLKIDAPRSKLFPISVGESHDLRVGQKVFAIGNPFGLDQSLTTGVISGLGRTIKAASGRPISDVIQTDAAINPGNSGGALLDSAGRLIGVNTAIVSPSGAYAGVGFAIPIDVLNVYVPQIIQTGSVEQPGLGIQIVPDSVVQRLVKDGRLQQPGVLVLRVFANGAASKAGILPTRESTRGRTVWGDLIIAVDMTPVERLTDLYKALSDRKVGDKISVTVFRDGQELSVSLVLQPLPKVE